MRLRLSSRTCKNIDVLVHCLWNLHRPASYKPYERGGPYKGLRIRFCWTCGYPNKLR